MSVIIRKLDNSFVKIENFDQHLSQKLREEFSFYANAYRFNPKYKSGIWNGKIYQFDSQTGKLPFGLAKKAIKIIRNYTKDTIIDFNIFNKGLDISDEDVYNLAKEIKFEHIPYEHQVEAIRKCLKAKRMTIESATGSGKSGILFFISNFLMMNDDSEKILIIVPSIQLVEQMTKDFCDYAENWCDYNKFIHKIYQGQDKKTDKKITISTYQSLLRLPKKYFEQFTTVMVDECHMIFNNNDSIKAVNRIINNCTKAENKFGFSGSLSDLYSAEIQLTSLFGKIERIVNAKELIDKDILADFDIKSIILDYNIDRRIELKNILDAIPKTIKNYETVRYKSEMDFVKELDEKLDFLVKMCSKLKKNTIVLFKSRAFGEKIYKELYKNSKKKVFYIDGTVPVLKREEIREKLEKYNDCILVGSVGTISTGINVKNIYNAVLAESIKSEIKIIQSIGRILRKLKDKKATLYDIADNFKLKRFTNYCIRHFNSRLKTYKTQGHDIKIVKIKI